MLKCILCESEKLKKLSKHYFHCTLCDLRFLDPKQRLSRAEERERYLKHENDIHDPRYQKFVSPLIAAIVENVFQDESGLDYGAGTGPVSSHLLGQQGFKVEKYDPLFFPDKAPLNRSYGFVFACEVIEHFFDPFSEFQRFHTLLKPGGFLALMTQIVEPDVDFEAWYYRRDPTHVAFYSKDTFQWICSRFGFSDLRIQGSRVITMRKTN